MENKLGITQARVQFSSMVERVQFQGDSYIISRNGKPAAAVVPVEVYETWKRQRRMLFDQIREMQAVADLTPEEAAHLASEAVAAVRADESRRS